mmetsp:Transcript_127981/g.398512  ORF Transcript_127981/g.398512 Transcript_127981/m.398512 type:complete len:575 (-) Transcript_127981:319-2043(-)
MQHWVAVFGGLLLSLCLALRGRLLELLAEVSNDGAPEAPNDDALQVTIAAPVLLRVDPRVRPLADCLGVLAPSAPLAIQGGEGYDAARHMKNSRTDIQATPLAAIRVQGNEDVKTAIRCAKQVGVQVCARAGGHGFENYAGCSGGLLIDVQDLQGFSVDDGRKVVTFGAGHTNGQLYYKLGTGGRELTVPGGTVSGVGLAGLTLGCGRGALTNIHGLACDSVLGLKYVDQAGNVHWANATHNQDMYWMARGSGGEFPGIVTEFEMQAYDHPKEIYERTCTIGGMRDPAVAARAKALMQAWWPEVPELVKPERKAFTHVYVWNQGDLIYLSLCIDCNETEKAWLNSKSTKIARAGNATCVERSYSWFDYILYESGVQENIIDNTSEALLDRKQGWGAWTLRDGSPADHLAQRNGATMLNTWTISDELIDAVIDWTVTRTLSIRPALEPYDLMILIFPLGGPMISRVGANETAYKNRDSKFVFATKHQYHNPANNDGIDRHHKGMWEKLQALMGCQGFYNYLDKDNGPCANQDEDSWLGFFFSDVEKMKAIKRAQDPRGVFRSRIPLGAPRETVIM